MGVSGISSPFGGLSRSSGQVPHVLLTRSPLGLPQYCYCLDPVRLACIKHAASVRPEPGSNSPSRSRSPEGDLRSVESRCCSSGNWRLGHRPGKERPTKIGCPSVQLTWYDSRSPVVARTGFCDIDRSRRRSSAIPLSRCAALAQQGFSARVQRDVGADLAASEALRQCRGPSGARA